MFPHFLKGLNLYPPTLPIVPQWLLSLVLSQLMFLPFEPLATCPLDVLSFKMVFLVAVTSVRRVSEITAFRTDVPFIKFHDSKIVLRPSSKFLPKIVSEFHLSQGAFIPNLSSDVENKLCTLDVRRAILVCLN